MWYLYVILGICVIVGIILLPRKIRDIVLKILLFPLFYVFSIITGLIMFPISYFKEKTYNSYRFVRQPNGDIEVIMPNGEKKTYKKEEIDNE